MPVEKATMPNVGRARLTVTDAASSVPTNGPTHAKDERANVRPINRVPAKPPLPEDWFSRVRIADGIAISKAPSRLSPKAMNRTVMKPLTQGLEPSCLTPTGPSSRVARRPREEKRTTIPSQKTTACMAPSRFPPDCWWRKYDMVMGIMGKTQGVKMEASPKPKATSRKAPQPSETGSGTAAEAAGGA